METKDIYNYLDYREFLSDFYKLKKSSSSNYSLRVMGRLTEIDPSYLAKVMSGKLHISPRSIPVIASYMDFDPHQTEYFENLVLFNKARSEEEKRTRFTFVLSLRKTHCTNLEAYQYAFFQHWYYSAVRNLLEFYPFYKDSNYELLAAQLTPAITEEEAKDSIKLLKRLNLITLTEEERYVLSDQAMSTGEEWSSLAISEYQVETIELSKHSIRHHEKERRDISTVTMNVSEEEFVKVRQMVQEFRSSVISYVNKGENPDRIYQLNIQLIPLSNELNRKAIEL